VGFVHCSSAVVLKVIAHRRTSRAGDKRNIQWNEKTVKPQVSPHAYEIDSIYGHLSIF
jgi:hypothetical protein